MPPATRAMHVTKVERRVGDRHYVSHYLRRTYREGGKVKHETLGNLSHLPIELIEVIRASLKGERVFSANDAITPTRSVPHGHVAAVVGALRSCGLESMIASRPSRERSLAVALIASRILDPTSKLALARGLAPETRAHTLAEVLELECTSEEELYGAMDWLLEHQAQIETKIAKKHLAEGTFLLYDVSGSHYTGRKCPLAKIGHPRGSQKNVPQINYGLLCDKSGCPVSIEVFEGNVGDPKTLGAQIAKVRNRFGIKRVVFVSDRVLSDN